MVKELLSPPAFVGCIGFMVLATAVGLAAYLLTWRLHTRSASGEVKPEVADATSNFIRVVGWLFCLLLTLTFTDVVSELRVTETAIETEAVAILDIHHDLRRFGTEAVAAHEVLTDYNRTVIDHDWPALAEGRLSEESGVALRRLEDVLLGLESSGAAQEILRSRIITDLEVVADQRMLRLRQSREGPPLALIVVFVGFLVTMVYFGVYRPSRTILGLMTLYTCFVGVIIYMVLSMSQPFQGKASVDASPLEYSLRKITAGSE